MNLIFIHGLPGVGKLTVANELSLLTGYKVFHNHLAVDLVGSIFEFGTTPFIELREKIWREIFERAAKERLPGIIFTFVFEKTVTENFIDDMLRIVESNRGKVLFVELRCMKKELDKRVTSPSRQRYGKIKSVDVLNKLIADGSIQNSSLQRHNLQIDNTRKTPSETAKFICEHYSLP